MNPTIHDARTILQKYWGYSDFREEQIPIISSILSGNHTLAVLTTGGGKSICFQVPALLSDGLCLVVTPLIALMKDQVYQLNKRGITAAAIYSELSAKEERTIYYDAKDQKIKFLYLSPERLSSPDFITWIRQIKVSLLAVDEAHCISQWGYDFRPRYLRIPDIYPSLGGIQVIALTATANIRVREDIIDKLELRKTSLHVSSFRKTNLSFQVIQTERKIDKLLEWIQKMNQNGIVYVSRRKHAQDLVRILESKKIPSQYYHGGLSSEMRQEKENRWKNTKNAVMVSTNAFGMGIDHAEVGYVIHYDMSECIDAYFQEAGRAGRAGQASYAIILSDTYDRKELEESIKTYPTKEQALNILSLLYNLYSLPYEVGENLEDDFYIEQFIDQYKLNYHHTLRAFSILTDQNLIKLSEAQYKPDEIQILFSESELHQFGQERPEYNQLLTNMIRCYEGIFERRRVDLHILCKTYHYQIQELRSMLGNLQKWEVIYYQEASQSPRIRFLIPRLPRTNIPFDDTLYEKRKQIILSQKKAVQEYLSNKTTCRQIQLLQYFDEYTSEPCNICDNCIIGRSNTSLDPSVYILIKDQLLEQIKNSEALSITDAINHNKDYPEFAIRKVIDRLLELEHITKEKEGILRLR